MDNELNTAGVDLSVFGPTTPKQSPFNKYTAMAIKQQESGGNPNAIGPMTKYGTAKGAFQFLDSTAAELGIDPFDEKQAEAATETYFNKNYGKLGTKELGLAAHNAGPGKVAWAVKQAGTTDWNEVSKYLLPETQKWVPSVLAHEAKFMNASGTEAKPLNTNGVDLSVFSSNKLNTTGVDTSVFQTQKDTRPLLDKLLEPFKGVTEAPLDTLAGAIYGGVKAVPQMAAGMVGAVSEASPFVLAGRATRGEPVGLQDIQKRVEEKYIKPTTDFFTSPQEEALKKESPQFAAGMDIPALPIVPIQHVAAMGGPGVEAAVNLALEASPLLLLKGHRAIKDLPKEVKDTIIEKATPEGAVAAAKDLIPPETPVDYNKVPLPGEEGAKPYVEQALSREEPVPKTTEEVNTATRDIIAQQVKRATSEEELKLLLDTSRLTAEQKAAITPDLIKKLYEAQAIIKREESAKPANLTEDIYTRNKQTPEEVINDKIKFDEKGDPIPIKDFGFFNGTLVNTSSWAQRLVLLSKQSPVAARILKAVYDEASDLAEVGHKLHQEMEPVFKEFNKLAKETEIVKDSKGKPAGKQSIILNVQKAFGWFEKNKDAWFDGKNYWPTVEQLKTLGPKLNDRQIKAFQQMTKVMDKHWDLLDITTSMIGREKFPRIPGYIPHVWEGGYSFIVEAMRVNPETGEVGWKPVKKAAFATRRQAKNALKEMTRDGLPNEIRIRNSETNPISEPVVGKTSISEYLNDIREEIDLIQNRTGQFKQLEGFLKKLEQRAQEGNVTMAMERVANMQGFTVDKLMQGEPLTRAERKSLSTLQEDTFGKMVKFYQDAAIAKKVYGVYHDSGVLPPNLMKAIGDVTNNFLGKNESFIPDLEAGIQAVSIGMGLPKHSGKMVSNFITATVSPLALAFNASFYVVNTLQAPLGIPSSLFRANMNDGRPVSAVYRAMGKSAADAITGKNSEMFQKYLDKYDKLYAEAEGSGKSSPVFTEHVSPTKVSAAANWALKATEKQGRLVSFRAGYYYFREFMSHEKALEAAGVIADEVMVPYGHNLGRPIIFNRGGEAGNLATMFATFSQHQFGQFYHDVKAAVQNPTKAKAYVPLLSFQLMSFAMYGYTGVMGAQGIGTLIDAMNKYFKGFNFPTMNELVRKMGGMIGAPIVSEFGGVSKMLGIDVSSSASQGLPGLSDIAQNYIGSIVNLLENSARQGASALSDNVLPPTKEEWSTGFSFLPKLAKEPLKQYLTSKDTSDFASKMTAPFKEENKDNTFLTLDSKLRGGTRISAAEQVKKTLTGSLPLSEAADRNTSLDDTKQKANDRVQEQRYMQLLQESAMGTTPLTPGHLRVIFTFLSGKMGVSESVIKANYEKAVEEAKMTREEREMDSGSPYRIKKYIDAKKLQPRIE